MRFLTRTFPFALALSITGCIVVVSSGDTARYGRAELAAVTEVDAPMKAFLEDGSTVLYEDGATIRPDSIVGVGIRYSLGLTDTVVVNLVPVDSLLGIEAFQGRTNAAASVFATAALTAAGFVGSVALFKAIFGSCPTFYASEEQGGALQAEAFSYSIAPLMEGRDLDALHLGADADGVLRMELRNEALETHYINHLEVVSVDHPADARAIPDDLGRPAVVVNPTRARSAVDRSGRALDDVLHDRDDLHYTTPESRIAAANQADDRDYIELTFDRPDHDSAALVLSLRNSLLTTVLFYDLMLERAGAEAIDWIGEDMARIGTVVELGRWFQEAMGLRVEVHDDGDWREVGRVADTGPIAWEEVAVEVPVPAEGDLRVRLSFFADAWRIDAVELTERIDHGGSALLPVARIRQSGALVATDALSRLAEPDDEYLATTPGMSAILEFDPPPVRPGLSRSYLLSSQGYYTEWVRREWIQEVRRPETFRPDGDTVESLMRLWLEKKADFEVDFYNSKIPVR